jgi:hypothetical protein
MNATDIIDTGIVMPRVGAIRVVGGFRLEIIWMEGSRAGRVDVIDLSPAIHGYKVFRPLRDNSTLFATARVVEDGYVIAWDGDNLEMSADMIQSLAELEMTPDDFSRFLERNRLSQTAAAALLGRSRRQVGYYLKPGPVPRVVALACLGYEALTANKRLRIAGK